MYHALPVMVFIIFNQVIQPKENRLNLISPQFILLFLGEGVICPKPFIKHNRRNY